MNIIPIPFDYKQKEEKVSLKGYKISSEIDLPLISDYVSDDGEITIKLDASLEKEEYYLRIDKDGADIDASSKIGAYYALQSLRQLSSYDTGLGDVNITSIHDKPRYNWRGLQLDESRHFFGKEEVKRLLDLMFMMKLNVFHWHLTDDQGWRIEIKAYPLLTEIGSKREYTQINGWGSLEKDNTPYSGYYTQDDIREIIAYAKERGIMVVPEIDMPAHFAAAMAAYPYLACREIETKVPGYFGSKIPFSEGNRDYNRTACMGKKTTFEFIFNVLDEICDLFDAPYFHIGGDEAPKNEWKKCPKCQQVIKDNNLKNEEELQGWFNNKIAEYLKSKDKKLIGWNEILTAKNLDKSVIAQYWTPRRDTNVEKYIDNGGKVIMSKHQSFYFDMPYAQYPLKKTYDFDLAKLSIDEDMAKNIIGLEGEVWSEWIDGRAKLDMNVFPRLQALAEIAWSPQSKISYYDFKSRLDAYKPTLDKLGVGYAVDKVSQPGLFSRGKIRAKFQKGNTHLELELNNNYKHKGAK